MHSEIKNKILTTIENTHPSFENLVIIDTLRVAKTAQELFDVLLKLPGLQDIVGPFDDNDACAEIQSIALDWMILHVPERNKTFTVAPLFFKEQPLIYRENYIRVAHAKHTFLENNKEQISFHSDKMASLKEEGVNQLNDFIESLYKVNQSFDSYAIEKNIGLDVTDLDHSLVLKLMKDIHIHIAKKIMHFLNANPPLIPYVKILLWNLFIKHYEHLGLDTAFAKSATRIKKLDRLIQLIKEDKSNLIETLRDAIYGYRTGIILNNNENLPFLEKALTDAFISAYEGTRTSQTRRILYNVGLTLITLGLVLPIFIIRYALTGEIGFFRHTTISQRIEKARKDFEATTPVLA